MVLDTVTLELNGEVSLEIFAEAVREFNALLKALSTEVNKEAVVAWLVAELDTGSALATVRGEATEPEAVERVVNAYATVGKALEREQVIPYSWSVRTHATSLTALLQKGSLTSLRFHTRDDDSMVYARSSKQAPAPQLLTSYGAIEGRIQTLTERGGLRFTLYDALYDRAVSCYLNESETEIMREVWGRRAFVEGLVSRDPVDGRPVAVRAVTRVSALADVAPGGWQFARGVSLLRAHDLSPEAAIRRVRDA